MDFDVELDNFLKIKTTGRDDSNYNFINFPYEPTPYGVLQELANSGYITKRDKIVDFGSGKGRVEFYLAYATKAHIIGVEYDLRLYQKALENKEKAISKNRVTFVNVDAKDYQIEDDVTGVYFFNPFSNTILESVIKNLKESKLRCERTIKCFFYYPSNEYLNLLADDGSFTLIDQIDCTHLYKEDNKRETIVILEL